MAFNGDETRELASQFVALAEKQGQIVPLMIGHRLMGTSLMLTGNIPKGRVHFNEAFALYDPAKHRPLATRFGQDLGVSIFVYRALARWMLSYPEIALADADDALEHAREWSRWDFDVCTVTYIVHQYPLHKICSGKRTIQ